MPAWGMLSSVVPVDVEIRDARPADIGAVAQLQADAGRSIEGYRSIFLPGAPPPTPEALHPA